MLTGGSLAEVVPTAELPSLFDDDHAFAREALAEVYDDPDRELEIRTDPEDETLLSLAPPDDLKRRFDALPQSYLNEQKIVDRLKVTTDQFVAESQLEDARSRTDSMWPEVGHLATLHPMLAWLSDKVLVSVARNEAPVIVADVAEPTFAIQGVYSNGRGQAQMVEWLAVTTGPSRSVTDLFEVLEASGITSRIANPGHTDAVTKHIENASAQVIDAVVEARNELAKRRSAYDADLDDKLLAPASRLASWVKRSNQMAFNLNDSSRRTKESEVSDVKKKTKDLIDSMRTKGDPMVRVLAVLVPGGNQ